MSCPDRDVLLGFVECDSIAPQGVPEHVAGCPACRERVEALRAALSALETGVEALAASAPPSLEARLVWRLRAPAGVGRMGATTLREAGAHGWRDRLRILRLLAAGAALAAALLSVAYFLGAPSPPASAAEVLGRSEAALLGVMPTEGALRIAYRVRYEGPTFGALPETSGDYRFEELYGRDEPAGFRLALVDADGSIVRGIAEWEGVRRVVVRTRNGGLDLTFRVQDGAHVSSRIEARRRQVARTFFDVLTRAAAPGRLSVGEQDGRLVVEFGPAASDEPALEGMFEVDRARAVVERTTYRLESAAVSGRLLGEPFHLEAEVERIEVLAPGRVRPEDFELPSLDGALKLEGMGTDQPAADVLQLLLDRVFREPGRAPE